MLLRLVAALATVWQEKHAQKKPDIRDIFSRNSRVTALFRLAVRKCVLHVHRLLLSSGMGIDGLIRQNIALAPGASSSGGKTVLTRQKHGVRMGARVSI